MWRLVASMLWLYAILAVYWRLVEPPVIDWATHLAPRAGAFVIPALYLVTYGLLIVVPFLLLGPGHAFKRLVASRERTPASVSAMVVAGALVGAGTVSAVTNPALSGTLIHLSGFGGWALSGLSFLVVASSEEVLFRGMLQTTLIRLCNPALGVLAGSVLFASFHVGEILLSAHATGPSAAVQFFGDVAVGVATGILAWRSGSLAIPIAVHWLGDWSPWASPRLPDGSTWGSLLPWTLYVGSLLMLESIRRRALRGPQSLRGPEGGGTS